MSLKLKNINEKFYSPFCHKPRSIQFYEAFKNLQNIFYHKFLTINELKNLNLL